jgi:hypothetical protein
MHDSFYSVVVMYINLTDFWGLSGPFSHDFCYTLRPGRAGMIRISCIFAEFFWSLCSTRGVLVKMGWFAFQ